MVRANQVTWDERISAYGRLVDAQRRLHRIFDRSLRRQTGMSIVWYEALLRLARSPHGYLTVNELGQAIDLTSGGATRLVDRLEASGYVERVACPTDRRVSWIALTDRGRESLAAATRVHLKDLDEHFGSRLDEKELLTLDDFLTRLNPRPNPNDDRPLASGR